MRQILAKNSQALRFAAVGVVNTGLDFGLFFGLTQLGLDRLVANFISTSISFIFSFFANKTYTFRAARSTHIGRQMALFIAVTLCGLWVIQPVIITVVLAVAPVWVAGTWWGPLLAKLVATLGSLSWNYVLYAKVVFPQARPAKPAGQQANQAAEQLTPRGGTQQ